MKNCKQLAVEWGLSERTINVLCKKGKIHGAIKVGKSWQIPDDVEKPADGRVSSGKYVKKAVSEGKKSLPIGISDYIRAQADYYYVDKTLLIKEFLDKKPLVSLFTRPRHFGKTLNMDMLRVFFEISDKDTSKYFVDKAIWRCGVEYRKHQGKYPVVFLTFKDVKFDSWKASLDKIGDLLQEEFGRHQELANSDKLAEYEKTYFAKIMNGEASEVDLTASLEKLSQMLTKHYGKAPIIIIDEYDTPIQEGYTKEFYDEIIGFMRNFFSGAFKDNKNLTYGFLTGILRIAQESIFSGLNNLAVNSVMDNEYKIKSNRESGDGRYDISLIPRENRYPGIIMELKWKKDLSEDGLTGLADEALAQINNNRYDAEMIEDGIQDILKFGIAFSGKKVCVNCI